MTAVLVVLLSSILLLFAYRACCQFQARQHALAERHRIDREVRLAQWQLQRVTNAAMQRLLDDARDQS